MEYCWSVLLITVLMTGRLGQALDVYMVLANKVIPEHSLVDLHNISDSKETGLRCVTQRVDCCHHDNGTRAEWFRPSNRKGGGGHRSLVRSRTGVGNATGYVGLHRSDGGSSNAEEGIYHCNIPAPSPSDDVSTLYVGIYKASDINMGIPTVIGITYDQLSPEMFTLICTSTGGPATTVNWTLDGSEIIYDANHVLTQTVVNTTTAEYNNTLTVTGREPGNYQCTVSNVRGRNTSQFFLVDFTETFTTTTTRAIPTATPSPSSHLPAAIAGSAVGLILIITLLVVFLLALTVYKRRKGTWPSGQCCLQQTDDTRSSINQHQTNPSTGQTLTLAANITINTSNSQAVITVSSTQASESKSDNEPKTSSVPGDIYAVVDKSKKVKRPAQRESGADPATMETVGPTETNVVYAVVQKGLKKKGSPPPRPAHD